MASPKSPEYLFYNFLRPHMALNGQTPAQAAGIDLRLEGNRWMALIREASKKDKTRS